MNVAPLQANQSPSDAPIIYEQPLSERVRTFLRLEFLFEQLHYHAQGQQPWDARAALASLLEILALLAKGDIRTEVLKELERQAVLLTRLRHRADVDHQRLTTILDSIEKLRHRLDSPERQFAQELRESEFLAALRNRAAIPGGTCAFDLPALYFWLSQPADIRRRDIEHWIEQLEPLRRPLRLLLMLIRESARPTAAVAVGGMYQMTFDAGPACQLIRVLLPADAGVFPEISGSKHRFTIRFLERAELAQRPRQTARDIAFQLVCCQL
ncbi:MAG TPA: cell division protein ZapD [Gammaproteobacteria bacterium]|nr:cell division protein ZapD [Gammaproteobacteria bacterium]